MPSAWWEAWENKDEETETASQQERELLPEGRHSLQVKQVTDDDDRLEIRLAHEDRKYGWVFCRLPHGHDWAGKIAATFARALRVKAGEWEQLVASGDLVGRRVNARVYHRTTDRGVFVNVGDFHEETDSPREEPKAKPQRKRGEVSRQSISDDIPF